jgi:hypothetical protein
VGYSSASAFHRAFSEARWQAPGDISPGPHLVEAFRSRSRAFSSSSAETPR